MRGVREREEVRVVESLQTQYKKGDCRSVSTGRRGKRAGAEKEGDAHLWR